MNDLKYELYIGAKPEAVWQILVSPEGTKTIFYGSWIESTFEVGASLKCVGPGNDGDETVHIYGTLLEFEPNKVLSYSEHPGPSYNDNHADYETRITFTLEPSGENTKLTLVNDRWTENHPSRANTEKSWPIILSNIKTFAETGKILDIGW
ncbi:hypothetical protein D3C73_523530 [compost metagenome]